MARIPKPWFRTERAVWCVHFRGTMHQLGAHPNGFPAPKQVKGKWNAPPPIVQAFHALLAAPPDRPLPPPLPAAASVLTVPDVFDSFLEWCQKNRSARTYEWSQNHIQNFLDFLPDKRLPVADLKPFHLQRWVDSKDTWGPNHTRSAVGVVQRAFNWAESLGLIDQSPVRHIHKPAPNRREQVLTRSEFDTLLSHVKDAAFRDVLEFCWETGARVQEVRLIEAAHYKPERGRVEIPPGQAKGKKRWRVIYLTDQADGILRRLTPLSAAGPVFRNVDGNPWIAQTFNNRFCRLHKKLGVKYALTAIRHSFATRMLEAGLDHLTVSALLGHADGAMLARVYSHVGENTDYLRDELRKGARGGSTE